MSPPPVHAVAPLEFCSLIGRAAEDPDAGLRPEAIAVREALRRRGLETPLVETHLSAEEKRQRIQSHFTEIMKVLGLDLSDDSLVDTPRRIAKMYVNEIFAGLDYHNFPKLTVVENKMQVDEMIQASDINLSSTCEHHFITIDGTATVAYIPKQKVIGRIGLLSERKHGLRAPA